jgi:hypothetical protein
MYNNQEKIEVTIYNYIKLIKINISSYTVKRAIVEHPSYPSLLSIADSLESLGILYEVGQVGTDTYSALEFPCLLHSNEQGGMMVLVKDSADLAEKEKHSQDWSGIVLKVIPNQLVDNKENKANIIKERIFRFCVGFLATGFLVISILSLLLSPSLLSSVILLTSIAGLGTGYLFVAKDIGIVYKTVEKFCNSDTQSGCDKVLNSKGATLLGTIKLADVVLAYFLCQFTSLLIAFLFSGVTVAIVSCLSVVAFFAIPIIIASLYYQRFLVRSWCKLCLVINSILFVQILLFIVVCKGSYIYLFASVLSNLCFFAFAFSLFIASVIILKAVIENNHALSYEKTKAIRIKRNPDAFGSLLVTGQKFIHNEPFKYDVFIGSVDAPIVMTMVTNLHCQPCKEEYIALRTLVDIYPNRLRINFIFVLSGKAGLAPNPSHYLLNYWLNYIEGAPNQSQLTAELIHDWFSLNNYEEFKNLHPITSKDNFEQSHQLSLAHYTLTNLNKVFRTPTLYINGYILPENYELNDIRYMVPSLCEYLPIQDLVNTVPNSNSISA